MVDDGAVIYRGTFVFAQANEHHFHQSAFNFAGKSRMRFYAVDHNDVIGFGCVLVKVDGHAKIRYADLDDVH